jgi:cytochrome c oxidase assembly protein Cox11
LPVSFFIDPAVLDDRDAKTVRDMTLSYTFFRVHKPASGPGAKFAVKQASGRNGLMPKGKLGERHES